MSLILDSSATLAWIYEDEIPQAIRAVFNQVIDSGAWAPSLWKHHDAAFRDSTIADLALLPIYVDTETDGQAWGTTLRLAERHRLTLYDAAYLELALRRGLPIATLDEELRVAAQFEKLTVLGI